MSAPVRPDTPAAQRLRRLDDARALRLMRRAGVAPSAELDIPPPPVEITPRQPADVSATPYAGPPRSAQPQPVLSRVADPGSLEARLGAVVDRERIKSRHRGVVGFLPGARVAVEAEKILGANLPGGAGEYMANLAASDEADAAEARKAHPVLAAAADVGQTVAEIELLGRVPGPVGRFFRTEGLSGAPATRGIFDASGRIAATAEREGVGTVTSRLARATRVEGAKFGALEAGRSIAERRPPEETVARGLAGAASGAVFGAGLQASSELLSLGLRTALRRAARLNMEPAAAPFRETRLSPPEPQALLAPPAEGAAPAGMPEHVANVGAAQRLALDLVGQTPAPPPGAGQSVAPIGDALTAAGNELAQLSLKPDKSDADLARLIELQHQVRQAEPPPAEPHAAAPATAAPAREIPEQVHTFFPERRGDVRPPRREIRLPEGAPEVLGGDQAEIGRHAAKAGEEGTLPQPRNKKFAKHDDLALEARWIQINDRIEAMAHDAGEGLNVWARTLPDRGTITGTTVTGKAGRALGRIKDDKRILGELEREFHARGINPRDVMDRYIDRAEQLQQSAEQTAERRAMETEGEGGDTSFNVSEKGKPYNEAALQDDLFGKPKLIGSEQTELLGKDAGKHTLKIKGTKIGADEVARVKREGEEPEGERPGELPGLVREVQHFYSRVRRALAAAPFEKGTGQQWLAYLEKVAGGTSREEREQTGIQELLEANRDKPVYQQELQFQIERQPLKLVERMYGQKADPELAAAHAAEERAYEKYRSALAEHGLSGSYAQFVVEGADTWRAENFPHMTAQQHPVDVVSHERGLAGEHRALAIALWDARRKVIELEKKHNIGVDYEDKRTAYDQYTLPGGKNYREIIVIAPSNAEFSSTSRASEHVREVARSMAAAAGEDWEKLGPNGRQRYFSRAETQVGLSYESSHWRHVPNPIGHLRITDRTVRGDPTLFIEEIQSDVHQAGREEGYRPALGIIHAANDEMWRAGARYQRTAAAVGRFLARKLKATVRNETIPNPPWSPGRPATTKKASVTLGDEEVGEMTLWPPEAKRPGAINAINPDRGWVFNGFSGTVMNAGTQTDDIEKALDVIRTGLLKERFNTSSLRGLIAAAKRRENDWINPALGRAPERLKEAEDAFQAAQVALEKVTRGVPKLPLARTEDWAGLMVRRAIDEAVRSKKTRLAWTTGRQQAERYDMQTVVDELAYDPVTQLLTGLKKGETVATHAVQRDHLSEWIGADVARRLLATSLDPGYHYLAGSDLAIGGTGQSVFYDQILPKIIVEQLRKLGGGKLEVERPFMDVPEGTKEAFDEVEGYSVSPPSEQPVWSVPIPESVRNTVEQRGLYIAEPRGRYGKKPPKLELEKGRPRDIGEALISEFGETEVPGHAGFLLQDGRLVNLSGDSGMRGDDHRIVETLFDYKGHDPQAGVPGFSRWDAVQRVMDDGIARVSFNAPARGRPGGVMVDVSRPLTGAQLRRIRQVIADYGREGGTDLALDFTVDGETLATDHIPIARPGDLEPALQALYDQGGKVREIGVKLSPWLTQRAKITEADAAFGGEQQMELALDRAVEQLQLKPEPAAKPATPGVKAVAHYRERSATARKIAADLAKGQATWIGRPFPNVWPKGAQPKIIAAPRKPGSVRREEPVGQVSDPAEMAKYRGLIDGVGAMLQTLRSPFIETLVLFATRGDKIVVSHVLTSGALSFVTTSGEGGVDLRQAFFEAAVKAGASHVHTAHNHPKGDPTPSGIGHDISMWAGFASMARRRGLTPGNNLVIDDNEYTITELQLADDGMWEVIPKFIPYHYSPKVPWFTPAQGFEGDVHSPDSVAAVVHRLGKENNGYLIHLDNGAKIVGIDPFTPADLEAGKASVEAQVSQAMERYGAARTIIGLNDRALFDAILKRYRESTTLQRSVLDIVAIEEKNMTGRWGSAAELGHIHSGRREALEDAWVNSTVTRRVHEPGPMAVPWRGQPGYTTDPSVQGSRSYQLPAGLPADGPQAVREAVGPGYGEDGLPNTASVIAQEALDAAEKLGVAPSAEGTIGKLLTAFAGTRMEQIGAPLHLVLVEYERQRAELEQLVQKDILKESLNQSAVKFLAGLPYFNEFRAVHLAAYLRDKLPRALGKQLGVTPDRQEALFNAAEAIAEFGPDGEPVFRDVRERSGELDQVGYERLLKVYGHPAKLEGEVAELRKRLDRIRGDMNRTTIALSPSAYAVERYKLGQRAKQEAKKGAAAQILSQLKTERNVAKAELAELKASQQLHDKEGILDEDAAAALPEEIAAAERRLNRLRAEISRFEGVVSGKTPAGPPLEPKDLPAKLGELKAKLDKWRELKGNSKEQEEALRTRLSNLGAFRRAYDAQASGKSVGQVRITEADARARWAALSKSEQTVVRRFATSAADAKVRGLEAHLNRELAKLEYEISSDIEAYVHHYGFEDEGALTLWFGSALRRKKLVAGARQFRGGAEGFKRNLEGARLHGGLPLSLQKLQNEFAEALERVMFTSPDPNLVRPLGADDDVPDGYTEVLGRFGELKGQRFAVANTVYKELEFFATKPPQAPTTDELANKVWATTAKGLSRAIYYWSLNQLLSVGTASRNFIGGAVQYAALVSEDLAKGDLFAAQKHLLALGRALAPANVRALPATEFGASQQTLRELDQAHGLFRAFMNLSLVPFGFVENFYKRALTLSTRELEAQRIAKEMRDTGTITKDQVRQVETELFHAPTFEMRASEELVRDAFAYNYNNIPLALKKMNKSAIGKALIPFPIYGYKFARHVGRYAGAVGRLGRMRGRAGDLQKALAAIILFGIPAVLTWLGDEDGKAKTIDPGEGVKYDFDRSGRVFVGLNDKGLEQWMRTNSYSFYGLGAVIGHTAHDRTLAEARNYVSEFYSVGPGFQAADYFRQVRNRYQTYRNASAIAGDFARSWIPFHRPLETATRMVDPTRRKQETFTESMLYAVPLPEPVLNQYGLSRGEPRTAMEGAQLVPGYDPYLEFMKEFAGVNVKPIDPKQAAQEYRRAAIRAQVRERRSGAETQRLRRLEERRRQRQEP